MSSKLLVGGHQTRRAWGPRLAQASSRGRAAVRRAARPAPPTCRTRLTGVGTAWLMWLVHLRALEGDGGCAAVGLAPVLPQVHVVLLMARGRVCSWSLCGGRRLGSRRVPPCARLRVKPVSLPCIELPLTPPVRRVTAGGAPVQLSSPLCTSSLRWQSRHCMADVAVLTVRWHCLHGTATCRPTSGSVTGRGRSRRSCASLRAVALFRRRCRAVPRARHSHTAAAGAGAQLLCRSRGGWH